MLRVGVDAASGKIIGHGDQEAAFGKFTGNLRGGLLAVAQFHREMKGRSLAGFTFEPHSSSHHFSQLARNGKAKSGAAVTAVRGAIGLAECFKDFPLHFRWNANACVADGKLDNHSVRSVPHFCRRGLHFTLFGEFHRIAHKVKQHLAKSAGIAIKSAIEFEGNMAVEFDVIAFSAQGVEFYGFFNNFA